MTITEKVAYIKGLIEGLDLDKNKSEVKVLSAIVELLDDISLTVSDLEDGYDELVEQVDAVDEDLYLLEEDFYEDEGKEDDGVFYEVTCPTCNETVCVSEPIILDGSIECPNCGENLEFDLDECTNTCEGECNSSCECDSNCDC